MHALLWFEIPALDLERAFQFYQIILNGRVRKGTFNQKELVLFDVPFNTGEAIGGSIVVREDLVPTRNGPIIYINAFAPLSAVTSKITAAGGEVVVEELDLGPFGYAAVFIDTEGNKIGLLSNER